MMMMVFILFPTTTSYPALTSVGVGIGGAGVIGFGFRFGFGTALAYGVGFVVYAAYWLVPSLVLLRGLDFGFISYNGLCFVFKKGKKRGERKRHSNDSIS